MTTDIFCIESPNDLKPGDIILFRPPEKISAVQKAIMFLQSLVSQKSGHYDTTHAAIYLGEGEIAHATEVAGKRRYVREPFSALMERDQDRAYFVYRPVDEDFAKEVARVAADVQLRAKDEDIPEYSVGKALSSFARRANLNENRTVSLEREISSQLFCSNFVVEALKTAAANLYKKIHPNAKTAVAKEIPHYQHIRSRSTPKTVEANLSRQDKEFTKGCYLGKRAYEKLLASILHQINRIEQRTDPKSREKCHQLQQSFKSIIKKNAEEKLNTFEKCRNLLKVMMPLLKHNTGFGLRNTSYNAVKKDARRVGIMTKDLEEEKTPSKKIKS